MYTFSGRVRFSETDSEEKLTFAGILNYLQDCSAFHSQDLGVGGAYLRERDKAWMLASWQVIVLRYPRLYEHITIGTQPYAFDGLYGKRNFCIRGEDGAYAVLASSLWCMVSLSAGKPLKITEEDKRPYEVAEPLPMPYAGRKIALPGGGVPMEPVTAGRDLLDANRHVNNEKYVSLAMRYLPEGFSLCQMRAEYKRQALLGDVITPVVAAEPGRVVVSLNNAEGKPYAVVELTDQELSEKERCGMIRDGSKGISGIQE